MVKKLKQKIIVLKQFQNQYVLDKIVNVNSFTIIAKLDKQIQIAIDSNNPTYLRDNIAYYFVELNSENKATHLTFNENTSFNIDVIDTFINQHVVSDITKQFKNAEKVNWKQNIMPFLLGLVSGAFIVFLYFQSQQTNLLT